MIRYDANKARVLAGIIRLLAAAEDAGPRRRGQSPLESDPRCDLCGSRPQLGRLLVSRYGIGQVEHEDGTLDFYGWVADNPLDAMYWVCLPCYRLLRRCPDALLRRMLEAPRSERN
jgi:hypothetical protein